MGYIDTRDLVRERESLRDEVAANADLAPSERLDCMEELERIKAIDELEEVGITEFEDGATLIPEDEFEEYARELADDLGTISDAWPARCIDWERAADELKMDYTSVEFCGETYLVRS